MIAKKYQYALFLLSFIITVCIAVIFISVKMQSADTMTTLWKFQVIDTMKYSRDAAGDKSTLQKIPIFVQRVAEMNASYIAIATPYDSEFYPVLSAWVSEARKYNLHIWFRGNFSSWEGWFGYKQMTDISQDHVMIKKFITDHPDLFQDGDIFTPVPEPENGAIGDPRQSQEKARIYNKFLVDSYKNCTESFNEINKNIQCGYFSMNGDVAKMVLTKNTVDSIGNTIVIDHYVNSAQRMGEDLDYLNNKFHAKLILGEFGAPIPDINGDMTEDQQAAFVDTLLHEMYIRRNFIEGVNYWTLAGGSTSLLNDDMSPRLVTQIIKKYYYPNVWKATVVDTLGDPITNAQVIVNNNEQATVQNNEYSVATPENSFIITLRADGYTSHSERVTFNVNKEKSQQIVLEPLYPSLSYRIRLFLHYLFGPRT